MVIQRLDILKTMQNLKALARDGLFFIFFTCCRIELKIDNKNMESISYKCLTIQAIHAMLLLKNVLDFDQCQWNWKFGR